MKNKQRIGYKLFLAICSLFFVLACAGTPTASSGGQAQAASARARDGTCVASFEGVTGMRFALHMRENQPHAIFEEIILGEPDE